ALSDKNTPDDPGPRCRSRSAAPCSPWPRVPRLTLGPPRVFRARQARRQRPSKAGGDDDRGAGLQADGPALAPDSAQPVGRPALAVTWSAFKRGVRPISLTAAINTAVAATWTSKPATIPRVARIPARGPPAAQDRRTRTVSGPGEMAAQAPTRNPPPKCRRM